VFPSRRKRHRGVATHGQPDIHNQLLTSNGLRLVDWESLMLAPSERDLRTVGLGNDTMVGMFELEWRLSEINIGATWLQAPHEGTADDHETLKNLREELGLPHRA
jgi:spectinomycin phosphotransferase